MAPLTWRTNKSGDLSAAYLGLVRVGYVMTRDEGTRERLGFGAVWWTTFIKPSSGAYAGASADPDMAKASLAEAVSEWCKAAGLVHASTGGSDDASRSN